MISSVWKKFQIHYQGTMDKCDYPVIFIDRSNPKLKNQDLDEESLKKSFNNLEMKFIFDKDELDNYIMSFEQLNLILLLMSSGKFGGIDVDRLSKNFCDNVG